MVRSLWTAASGMIGQQASIDTISNNLANVNTSGYKKMRADFEDLIYQTVRVAGTPATEDTVVPVPVQMGHGVKLAATPRQFTQGNLQNTESFTDIAIMGDGFFRVMMYDGSYAYSRDGAFKIDSNGQFVTSNGYKLMPEVVLPQDFIPETLSISQDGRINVKVPAGRPRRRRQAGTVPLCQPRRPDRRGKNLFKLSNASGDPLPGRPGFDGMGKTIHKFLEMSNVSVVREMVNMIVAQRAYEFNSKAIQTSDNMLGTATNLKR
ncbi:flagellar basal-body rod protein FlgG [Spirochaetota bacterium]